MLFTDNPINPKDYEIMATAEEDQAQEVLDKVKKGFSLHDRLSGRALRSSTIVLYLDENTGKKHKDVLEQIEKVDREISTQQTKIDLLPENPPKEVKTRVEREMNLLNEKKESLEAEAESLLVELKKDSLSVRLKAVPPKIAKDCHRRAKLDLDIKGKTIPDELTDEFLDTYYLHLLCLTIQSITDAQTGEVNEGLTLSDVRELADYLPVSQYDSLRAAASEIQLTDAFSSKIEQQEDFS